MVVVPRHTGHLVNGDGSGGAGGGAVGADCGILILLMGTSNNKFQHPQPGDKQYNRSGQQRR